MLLNMALQHDQTVVVSKNLCLLPKKCEDFHSAMRKAPQLLSRDTIIVHYHTQKKNCFTFTADGTIRFRISIQNAIAKKVWGNEFSHIAELDQSYEGSKLKSQVEQILEGQIKIPFSSIIFVFVLSLPPAPCLVNSSNQIILEENI